MERSLPDVKRVTSRRRRAELARPASAFLANGALYGSLLARYPEIADRVQASASAFGLALLAAAVGGFAGSLVARPVTRRIGEVRGTVLSGCGYALLTVAVATAPNLFLLAGALFLTNVCDGAHDVTMNTYAVRAQQHHGVKVMGRMHALWSLGLTGAGLVGAGAASVGVPVALHVGIAGAFAFGVHLVVVRGGSIGPATETGGDDGVRADRSLGPSPWRTVVLILGVAAFAASYIESPGQEWTGLVLGRGLHADAGVAASAPVAFSVGLMISRLLLDVVSTRFGGAVAAAGASLIIVVSTLAGWAVTVAELAPGWALAAVACAGIGAGPVFPLLFGAADHLSRRDGIAPATSTSMVSALSRVGAISAPPTIGFLSEGFGLATVFAVMAAGGVVLLAALPRAVR
jgi:MFS family permease